MAAGIELNLPDLPEVPISLGPVAGARPAAPRAALPWPVRLRDALASYLPLLLMVLLALGTWWLVKNSPQPPAPREQGAPRGEPDYTMNGFSVQRFDRDGQLQVQLEGRQLRHYPDVDRIEIDDVTLRAYAATGRVTVASARRAIGNGDTTELQLIGAAQVTSQTPAGMPVEVESEYLHFFRETERVRSHLPVRLRYGANVMRAGGVDYDNLAQRLELGGPMRGVFAPAAAVPGAR